jgi:hypothetical protein
MDLLDWLARLVIGAVVASDMVDMAKGIGKTANRIGRKFSRKTSANPSDKTPQSD